MKWYDIVDESTESFINKRNLEEEYRKNEKVENFWNEGLNPIRLTNKYITMKRVNKDETKIVVKVSPEHLLKTAYGYALILNDSNVVFVKDQQVNQNYYGSEVILNKQYFNVKKWGNFPTFTSDTENLEWKTWLKVAKDQEKANNKVQWEYHYVSPKTKAIVKNIYKNKGV